MSSVYSTELMVGDFVLTHTPMDNNPIRIEYINRSFNSCYEPIPLTLEILGRNGFIRHYDGDIILYSNKDFVEIEVGVNYTEFTDGGFYVRGIFRRLYYVHELQHALRLLGKKELADNLVV